MNRLAAVNFFLAVVGLTQVTRIVMYKQSVKDTPVAQLAEDEAKNVKETTKAAAEKVTA